jgi:hypothetical protein
MTKDKKQIEFMEYPLLCEECRKMNQETILLGEIRKAIKEDMRNIIREELGIYTDHEERMSSMELWQGCIKIGKKRIYFIPLIVLGGFIWWVINLVLKLGNHGILK